MKALTALVANRVIAIIVVLLGVVVAGAFLITPTPEPDLPRSQTGLDVDYQSTVAERALDRLPEAESSPAIVVLSRTDEAALTAQDLAEVEEVTATLTGIALGGQVAPAELSEDGTVAVLAVPLAVEEELEQPRTVEAVNDMRATLADLPEGLVAEVTGGPGFAADNAAAFSGANLRLLVVSVIVVAVILLITYRSPLLLVVPLAVVVGAEIVVAQLNLLVLPAVNLPEDPTASGITSVLVFGATTNYALLLIARYREQLRTEPNAVRAMQRALRGTAPAILASGTTVVLAVLTLLLASTEGNQTLAVSAALGVITAMIAALIVLPAALVLWQRALFWPFVPRHGSQVQEGRIWGYLGARVAARPRFVAAIGTLGLAALATGALGVQVGLAQNEEFRVVPESVQGAETLARVSPAGSLDPAVVATTPDRVAAVTDAAAGVAGVAGVEPGQADDTVAEVLVVLDAEPGSSESYDVIEALRAAVATADPTAAVGGTAASTVDQTDAQARDLRLIAPIILALVFAVLVVLLRAIVAPVLLILSVVATYVASIGAAWLLFRSPLLDFPALDDDVLLLVFVFLVALGVDYNIFLVTRAREESERHGTREGMLTALRVTGGVITSAGVLLAAVFVVLGVLPILVLTQIGIIVCIGVLLDTLLVRTVIVPALALTTGERFWWPATVFRGQDQVGPADEGAQTPLQPVGTMAATTP